MGRAKKYIVNALILSGCTLLMRTVAVAFNAFCVNKVGEEGMGLFSLVMSVYTFAVTLATSGVNLGATRLVALHYGNGNGKSVCSAMGKCMLYSLFFGSVASLSLFFFSDFVADNFLNEHRAAMSVRALSLSLLPLSFCSAFSGYFAAVRRVYKNAISQVLEQGVKILSCTFLLSCLMPKGIEYACLALVLGGTVSELFSFAIQVVTYLFDKQTLRGGGGKVPLCELLGISLPVAFSAYVRSGLVTIEHILIPIGLTAYGDENALATYGIIAAVALPIVLYPTAFVGAFSGQIIPEITECYAKENKKEVAYITGRAFFATLFFSIMTAGMFSFFAKDICMVIYKSDKGAEFLRALAPLMPVMFLDTATDSILKGLGKQFYTMCVNIADAAISVVLVWLLVPKIGVWGYIAVIYSSELVNTVFSIGKLLSMVTPKINIKKLVIIPLLSVVLSSNIAKLFLSLAELPLSWGVLVLECLLYIGLYLGFSSLFGAVGKEEFAWIKNIFHKEAKSTTKSQLNLI